MRCFLLLVLFVAACVSNSEPHNTTPHPVDPIESDEPVQPDESDTTPVVDTDQVVIGETDLDDSDTDPPPGLSAPTLNPGYVDITPADVRTSPVWTSPLFVSDYPIVGGDINGDCLPELNSADCNGWTCKRPTDCSYEVLFQAQRTNRGDPVEQGLVYSYNRATQTWDVPAFMSSLSSSRLADVLSQSQYYGLAQLHGTATTTFTNGMSSWMYKDGTWREQAWLDPGACNTQGGTVFSYGDFDRDGWLDVLQPANGHIIEGQPPVTSITITCNQGPVVLQTQTPDSRWLYHNTFVDDGDADILDDYHDSYAFVNTWNSNGSFQVLAMGRPRPNQVGTATGWWGEVGEDAHGFPVAEQQEFIGAFTQVHPMGGDYVWYYDAGTWNPLLFATTNNLYTTAGMYNSGWWVEMGQALGLSFPLPPLGSVIMGPWGALQADPDKNGVSDLFISLVADFSPTPSPDVRLQAWYRTGPAAYDQFVEWPEGTLGDLNVRRGGHGGRSLALFDIDSDGDLDVLDVGANAAPRVLRNDIPGNSISVSLVGQTSNAMGVGSIIELTLPNGYKQRRTVGAAWNPSTATSPNYEFGLAGFTEANVIVNWHSGITINYGTVQFDASAQANNAYVLYEPPVIKLSDTDRLMSIGGSQVATVCPYASSGVPSASTQVELSLLNYDGAHAVITAPRPMGNGCYDATLRAGSTPGSMKLQVYLIQNGVRTKLNVQPRIWIEENPGFVANWE